MEHANETPTPEIPMPTDEHIERYVVGDGTANIAQDVEAWLQAGGEEAAVVRWLRGRLRQPVVAPDYRPDMARIRAEFVSRTTARTSVRLPRSSQSRRGWALLARIGVTTAALGAVVFGLRQIVQPTVLATPRVIYRTAAAECRTITLGDGTRVTLAPSTTVEISHGAASGHRVALTGEAYFDVVHAERSPFVVRTGGVTTEVLGTAFDVKYHATDSQVRIVVLSGKVVTRGRGARATLTAGTVANVTDSTLSRMTPGEVQSYTDWTHGNLTFRRTPLTELLRSVGAWYGIEFRLTDSTLATNQFTLTLNHKTRAEALALLGAVLNATMTVDTSTATPIVTVHPRRAGDTSPRNGSWERFSHTREVGR